MTFIRPRLRRAQHLISAWSLMLLAGCSAPTPPTHSPSATDKIVPAQVTPAAPMQFEVHGGESLAARVWSTPKPRHIVLGVHGFNDYSKAFEPLAQHLAGELGATVYAYDQRGFGANPKPGIWPGTDTLLADLRDIATQLRERHPGLPLTVVGESMGGSVTAAAFGSDNPPDADRIVLLAPGVWGWSTQGPLNSAALNLAARALGEGYDLYDTQDKIRLSLSFSTRAEAEFEDRAHFFAYAASSEPSTAGRSSP